MLDTDSILGSRHFYAGQFELPIVSQVEDQLRIESHKALDMKEYGTLTYRGLACFFLSF